MAINSRALTYRDGQPRTKKENGNTPMLPVMKAKIGHPMKAGSAKPLFPNWDNMLKR